MSETTAYNGKSTAIISYITFIGWFIAFVMNNNNKSDFGVFHLRQSLGIIAIGALLTILDSIVNIGMLVTIFQFGVFVLWIIGLVGAIQGQKKLVPFLGDYFQDWFKGIV